ncbi:MAG: ABC transporter permease [Micropruina sp.]
MTALDLTPDAHPAPRWDRVLRHARVEASLTLRNGEQLLLALAIPLGLLVWGSTLGRGLGWNQVEFPASVLALGLWSTGFTSLAIITAFERRYGVLERLAATPLTRTDLLVGKALATIAIAAGQAVLVAGVAGVLGWRPTPTLVQTLLMLAAAALALVVFASWALALASVLRAEATLGVANLIYLLLAVLGGLIVPLETLPDGVRGALALLPTGALGEALRGWSVGSFDPLLLLPLSGWALLSALIARKVFRWMS